MGNPIEGAAGRIMLVEHDKAGFAPLAFDLRRHGFTIQHLNARTALDCVRKRAPDAVVIGKLSEAQGRGEMCRQFRDAARDAPMRILVVLPTPSALLRDHIVEQGADACLAAPLSAETLIAQIAIIGARGARAEGPVLRHGDLEMRPHQQKLFIGTARVRLRPALFALLRHFLEHPDRIHSIEELIAVIGKPGKARPHLTVASRIESLRASLADSGIDGLIRTIGSKGYGLASRMDVRG